MKIALMMENSRASKMPSFITNLAPSPMKRDFRFNVGMCDENDHHLTYIHLGIMASILLNANAVDFVVTGCGTGQGALMSLNIHPVSFVAIASIRQMLFCLRRSTTAMRCPCHLRKALAGALS